MDSDATDRDATADPRPLMLLVGSSLRPYCEYLLALFARGARVWLLTNQAPSWEQAYIVGHTLITRLDVPSLLVARVARTLHARTPFQGVLCWDEGRTLSAAQAAEALGLPGGEPQVVLRCRDKHQTRTALAAAGVPSAVSVLTASFEEARQAAARIGYPLVAKPRALSASLGVSRVDSPEQLERAYVNARDPDVVTPPSFEECVLIEEYLDGPEISCDCAVSGGRLTLLVVARKLLGFPPYFEEIGHSVDAADPLRTDPHLLDVLTRAHDAVGFRDGLTHTELRLTASGPKIVEINCRLGGDLIPYLGYLATGIDPARAAVAVARGLPPDATPTRQRVAAVHFFYASRDVTVSGIDIDRSSLPAELVVVEALAPVGRELRLPPRGHVRSRYALAVVVADTQAGCRAALHAAARAITLRTADGQREPACVRDGD